MPDGRIQTVNYKADKNGFQADILYDGHAVHQAEKPHPQAPAHQEKHHAPQSHPQQYTSQHETKPESTQENNQKNIHYQNEEPAPKPHYQEQDKLVHNPGGNQYSQNNEKPLPKTETREYQNPKSYHPQQNQGNYQPQKHEPPPHHPEKNVPQQHYNSNHHQPSEGRKEHYADDRSDSKQQEHHESPPSQPSSPPSHPPKEESEDHQPEENVKDEQKTKQQTPNDVKTEQENVKDHRDSLINRPGPPYLTQEGGNVPPKEIINSQTTQPEQIHHGSASSSSHSTPPESTESTFYEYPRSEPTETVNSRADSGVQYATEIYQDSRNDFTSNAQASNRGKGYNNENELSKSTYPPSKNLPPNTYQVHPQAVYISAPLRSTVSPKSESDLNLASGVTDSVTVSPQSYSTDKVPNPVHIIPKNLLKKNYAPTTETYYSTGDVPGDRNSRYGERKQQYNQPNLAQSQAQPEHNSFNQRSKKLPSPAYQNQVSQPLPRNAHNFRVAFNKPINISPGPAFTTAQSVGYGIRISPTSLSNREEKPSIVEKQQTARVAKGSRRTRQISESQKLNTNYPGNYASNFLAIAHLPKKYVKRPTTPVPKSATPLTNIVRKTVFSQTPFIHISSTLPPKYQTKQEPVKKVRVVSKAKGKHQFVSFAPGKISVSVGDPAKETTTQEPRTLKPHLVTAPSASSKSTSKQSNKRLPQPERIRI